MDTLSLHDRRLKATGMRRARLLWIALTGILLAFPALLQAQLGDQVKWTARLEPADARAGEGAQIVLTAKINATWHLYSLKTYNTDIAPQPTTITLEPGTALTPGGKPIQPKPIENLDPNFNLKVEYYANAVAFGLPVKIAPKAAGAQKATVKVRYMMCNDTSCLPPKTVSVPVTFTVAAGAARPDRLNPVITVPKQPEGAKQAENGSETPVAGTTGGQPPAGGAPPAAQDAFKDQYDSAKGRGVLVFMGFAFLMGLVSLLTPCVFPMVPITVSFFSKQKNDAGRRSLTGPLAYCVGIIATFTALGLLVTIVFGASGVQRLATNPFINLGLAALFLVLAANLFGVFEITIPASLVNRFQGGRKRGGFIGPLMMGLAFTLTSFTCTAPFVGTLLASAAQGSYLYPLLGMLAFSTAFSLPFFLLALFPQYLANVPKAGSWLTSVKVVMGFLEVAAAVKFLSNIDLVWQWGLLTRPIFLAVWATIGIVAALYLVGWILLPHEREAPVKIGWPRRTIGMAAAAAGIYCLAAIEGAPLGTMEAFLPPDPYPGRQTAVAGKGSSIVWLEDYDKARELAKSQNKPLFIDFTGVTCTNCRYVEKNIFPHQDVERELEKFVTVKLYTDRDNPNDARNQRLQQQLVNSVTLPSYVIATPEGVKLKSYQPTNFNVPNFVAFLQQGLAASSQVARQ
jgi:thiol:disulfide interchange protein DsbD